MKIRFFKWPLLPGCKGLVREGRSWWIESGNVLISGLDEIKGKRFGTLVFCTRYIPQRGFSPEKVVRVECTSTRYTVQP